jgi:predicted MFS family arabinose efflux permease
VPFLVDGVSYLASIFSVLGLRTSLRPAGDQPRPNVRRDAREAFAFLMGQPVLRLLAAVGAVGDVLFGGIGLVLIVYAQRRAAASPAAIGAIFAVAAGASIVGSIAGVRLVRRVDVGRALVLSAVAGAALFPILATAHTVTLIAVVWAGNVLVTNAANVGRDSFQLSKVPIDLLGRVNGLVELVSYGGLPLGTALSGFALAAFGPVRTVVFIAAGRVLLTAVLVASSGVRRATLA